MCPFCRIPPRLYCEGGRGDPGQRRQDEAGPAAQELVAVGQAGGPNLEVALLPLVIPARGPSSGGGRCVWVRRVVRHMEDGESDPPHPPPIVFRTALVIVNGDLVGEKNFENV